MPSLLTQKVTKTLAQKNSALAAQHKKTQAQLKEALTASDKASLMIKDLKREVRTMHGASGAKPHFKGALAVSGKASLTIKRLSRERAMHCASRSFAAGAKLQCATARSHMHVHTLTCTHACLCLLWPALHGRWRASPTPKQKPAYASSLAYSPEVTWLTGSFALLNQVESKSIAHSQAKAANEVMHSLNQQLQ
eukprot:scaffold56934_cov23-Tisochrysis_lutea.AAC.2